MSEVGAMPAYQASTTEQLAHAVASILGEPLLDGWRHPAAIQARQDHLAAVANFAGAAMIELRLYRAMPAGAQGAVLRLFVAEMMALDNAMRDYTHRTQRGDATAVVQDALVASAGAALAAALLGVLDRARAAEAAKDAPAASPAPARVALEGA